MFGSFIKIGSSCVKYMPQVYLNWKRKCTLGFAIDKGLVFMHLKSNTHNLCTKLDQLLEKETHILNGTNLELALYYTV